MVCNDKKYRQVTNSIGVALIVLVVLIQGVLYTVPAFLQAILAPFGSRVSYVAGMLSQIVFYMLSFMIPAFILRSMLKKRKLCRPMMLGFKLSAHSLWLIPAGMAVCFSGSIVNSYIMNLIVSPEIMESMMGVTEPYQPYTLVLELIAVALVPAVCEEFLFRGAVAANLLPFGRGVAVVGSALLFAFMHQNPYQMFYTLLAGLVLGYVYVKTESILVCTVLHFCNNATSVLQNALLANLSEETGMLCYYVVTAAVYILGAIGIVAYFTIERKKSTERFEGGSFGRLIEADDGAAVITVSRGKKLSGFLSPAMIVYCCLAIINMLTTLGMLLLISAVGL